MSSPSTTVHLDQKIDNSSLSCITGYKPIKSVYTHHNGGSIVARDLKVWKTINLDVAKANKLILKDTYEFSVCAAEHSGSGLDELALHNKRNGDWVLRIVGDELQINSGKLNFANMLRADLLIANENGIAPNTIYVDHNGFLRASF